jgi:hypothetical protein
MCTSTGLLPSCLPLCAAHLILLDPHTHIHHVWCQSYPPAHQVLLCLPAYTEAVARMFSIPPHTPVCEVLLMQLHIHPVAVQQEHAVCGNCTWGRQTGTQAGRQVGRQEVWFVVHSTGSTCTCIPDELCLAVSTSLSVMSPTSIPPTWHCSSGCVVPLPDLQVEGVGPVQAHTVGPCSG